MLKAVFFDWDGTLQNSIPVAYGVYRDVFKTLGLCDLSFAVFQREFTLDHTRLYSAVGVRSEQVPQIQSLWKEFYEKRRHEIRPARDAGRVLETLYGRGLGLAVVTDGSRERVLREISENSLGCFFRKVVTRDDVPDLKPSPAKLLHALDSLGFSAEETMYVGDAVTDVLAGKKAGVRTAAVATGVHPVEDLRASGPDYVLENLGELSEVLCGEA